MGRTLAVTAAFCLAGAPTPAARGPVAISISQLDNGLQVCVRRYPAAPTVGAAIAVGVSVFDEPEGWEGARQLLARCLVDRARASMADAGVVIGAEVKTDFVLLHARALPDAWRRAVGALLDAAFHAHFDTAMVRFEQMLMRHMEDQAAVIPATVASRAGLQALYPAIRRAGRPTAAYRPAIRAFVDRFYRQHFRPNAAALTVSGPLTAAEVVGFVERATSALLPAGGGEGAGAPAEPQQTGTLKVNIAGEGAAVWVGARMPPPDDRDYPAALVATAVIGGGMGSRVFRRLRDELSLVYSMAAQVVASHTCPYAYVLCTCRPEDCDRVGQEINELIADLVSDGPSEAEVDRARRYAATQAGEMALSNWQAAAFVSAMTLMAPQMPWRRGPSALAAAIGAVTASDVRTIARNWWAKRTTIEVKGY